MTTPAGDRLPSIYRFADLTLDVARRGVTRQGRSIELKALDFDLLRFLVESAPDVVNADVLAEKVWGRHFVSPENVAQRVKLLRQSLADDANRPRYIQTVRNKGYRLIPVAERVPADEGGTAPRRRGVRPITAALLLLVGLAAAASYWLAGTTRRPQPPAGSVAVLPFENLSPDPSDAFFAAGMRDEIVSQLTKISGLRVFPVSPSGGALRSIPDVGRDLNVAMVLGGGVHYAQGRVRVNTHLTHAATSENLWSESYERERSDIFAIQSAIALDVAQALSLKLSATERERVERVPTANPQARDLYLIARARALSWRESPAEWLRAVNDLEHALDLDPEFIEAWVQDAYLRSLAQFYDPEHAVEHRTLGEQAARRALALEPEHGAAHVALGFALWTKKDWSGAEAAYRRALSLNVPLVRTDYEMLHLSVGKFASARKSLEEKRAAEPENPIYHRFLAFANAALGEWGTATALYESGLRVFMPWREGPNNLMHWLIGRNELAEARAIPMTDSLNTTMLASLDAPEEALAELRRAYADSVAGNPNYRRDIGLWAGHFGDAALALDAMRAAIDEQGGQAVYLWYPQLAPMRHLSEFKAYLREIGMVAYWQEYGWPAVCRPLDAHDFECE